MPIYNRQFKMLNDKNTFMLWYELGTLKRVVTHLTAEGIVNSKTSKPITPYAIWISAMRFVMENPDEAYPMYVKAGSPMTREEWEVWLIKKAMRIYGLQGKSRFFLWLRRFGYDEKHKEVYSKTFGVDEL